MIVVYQSLSEHTFPYKFYMKLKVNQKLIPHVREKEKKVKRVRCVIGYEMYRENNKNRERERKL